MAAIPTCWKQQQQQQQQHHCATNLATAKSLENVFRSDLNEDVSIELAPIIFFTSKSKSNIYLYSLLCAPFLPFFEQER
jgi:hypothetical protein